MACDLADENAKIPRAIHHTKEWELFPGNRHR